MDRKLLPASFGEGRIVPLVVVVKVVENKE
jgi:hypothetical protein